MKSIRGAIKSTRIICICQIATGLIAVGIFTYLYRWFEFTNKTLEITMLCLAIPVATIAAFISYYRFRRVMQRMVDKPFEERISAYRSAAAIRNTIVEAISLLFTITFFLTGSIPLLLAAILGAFIMVFFYPTNIRMAQELTMEIHEFETLTK